MRHLLFLQQHTLLLCCWIPPGAAAGNSGCGRLLLAVDDVAEVDDTAGTGAADFLEDLQSQRSQHTEPSGRECCRLRRRKGGRGGQGWGRREGAKGGL